MKVIVYRFFLVSLTSKETDIHNLRRMNYGKKKTFETNY